MKIAVQIRAHQDTEKLRDLIDQLKGSTRYDLYLSYDVSHGTLDIDGATTLPYTRQTFIDLGLPVEADKGDNVVMWAHCDYTLYAARKMRPDYDAYISIEFDVEFIPRGPHFVHDIIDRLESERLRPIDLIVAQLGPAFADSYDLYRPAAALYPKVYACLCPVSVFSAKALDHLFGQKLIEASRGMQADDFVHWEAFVATALLDAGTFRVEPFESLYPGCAERETYRPGLPMLLGHPPKLSDQVRMIHPVLAEREFGLRHIYYARVEKRLERFLEWLERGEGQAISPAFRAKLRDDARHHIALETGGAVWRIRHAVNRMKVVKAAKRLLGWRRT